MVRTLSLALLLAVLLAACGGNEQDALVGHWIMIDWNMDARQFSLDVLPDGRYIISSSDGYKLEGLWEVEADELCRTLDVSEDAPEDWMCVPYLLEDDYLITSFVWTEDFTFRRD